MDGLAGLLSGLDYAAVAVFAATGALAAARRKHDIVTFAFFAAVTGVGGGALRDLLIGAPVFWVAAVAVWPAGLVGFLLAVGLRAGAILFGWSLPGFPGRTPPEQSTP